MADKSLTFIRFNSIKETKMEEVDAKQLVFINTSIDKNRPLNASPFVTMAI